MSTMHGERNTDPRVAVPSPVAASTAWPDLAPLRYPAGVPRRLHYPTMPAWGLMERAFQQVPDRTAIDFLGRTWTYRELHEASLRLAAWLQSRGILAGRRVGVLLPNCPEYAIALPAIWRAGGVVVTLSPLAVADDIRRMLELTECDTVICLDVLDPLLAGARDLIQQTVYVSLADHLPALKKAGYLAVRAQRTGRLTFGYGRTEIGFREAITSAPQQWTPVEVLPHRDPAYILGTSGTTGVPKAVTLSHRNLVCNAWQQLFWAGASMGQETLMAVLPFFHSYGMSAILNTGFALGATLVVLPRFHPRQMLRVMVQKRPTVLHAVPAMLAALNKELRQRPADLSSLKWVISGGAALDPAIGQEFAEHTGALVVEGYGLSEASPVTHVGPLDGSNVWGTIGLPLPDTYCRIVDPQDGGQEIPVGQVGELVVMGPQVMLGYWKNPAATDAVLRGGWLYTGDLARCRADGFYEIVDRKKDLIITNGFNVYPAEVEAVLVQCEGVREAAVVGVPDPDRGEIVKAFVVMEPGAAWDPHRMDAFCRQRLAAHMRPRLWERVEGDLPRNFLGKVVRRELRGLQQGASDASTTTTEIAARGNSEQAGAPAGGEA
ncbi:MAG: long-chain fatty acid--CoA ligase [Planctomycetota bacterium]|nr:MAG: long-chain fatty acid--CoA ligase [Planctomycetota bacterium]